jgi:hypothetical protein
VDLAWWLKAALVAVAAGVTIHLYRLPRPGLTP